MQLKESWCKGKREKEERNEKRRKRTKEIFEREIFGLEGSWMFVNRGNVTLENESWRLIEGSSLSSSSSSPSSFFVAGIIRLHRQIQRRYLRHKLTDLVQILNRFSFLDRTREQTFIPSYLVKYQKNPLLDFLPAWCTENVPEFYIPQRDIFFRELSIIGVESSKIS